LPWFEFFFVDPVGENELLFETDRHLGIIKSPVLIMHAEDDIVVPYQLGRRVCIWCINTESIDYFTFFCGEEGGK
jgi:abhydrolase domain-containing protein 12